MKTEIKNIKLDMNYFVSVQGNRIAANLERQQAINLAIKEHDKNPKLGGIELGIGITKYKKGQKVYTMVPYFYHL